MNKFIHDIEWHKEHKRLGFYDPIAELAEELEKIQLSKKDATFDCISRQAAIDAIARMGIYDWIAQTDVLNVLEHLPSAQPEIIKCEECKHYYYADNRIPQEQRYVCDLDGDRWKADSFCSYAERRTDG